MNLTRSSSSAAWRQVLWLGEQLMVNHSLDTQKELIIETSKDIFNCNAAIWLSDSSGCDSLTNISPLMQYSLSNRRIASGENSFLAHPRSFRSESTFHKPKGRILALAAPLLFHDVVLGVLQVERPQGPPFKPKEIALLEGLAIQSTIAIHSKQQIASDHQQVEILNLVRSVSAQITEELDLDQLFRQVTRLILETFGYYYVAIFTVEYGEENLLFRNSAASLNKLSLRDSNISPTFSVRMGEGIIGYVAQTGKEVIANDVTVESRYRCIEVLPETKAEFALPLRIEEHILGVLDVQADHTNAFKEIDILALHSLADNIATAIRNARLYHSEQWRRHVAESMREVAGLLTTEVAVDQVLNRILYELEKTLPCNVVAIWLVENKDNQGSVQLNLSAVHLSQETKNKQASTENGLSSEELILFCNQSLIPNPWLYEVLTAESPIIRASETPYEPLGVLLDYPADYSAIAAPLRVGDQALGVLALAHSFTGRYGREAQLMVETFAHYAAIAIENTRLYKAAHDQAWISTVLLQVAEATQSLNSLDELVSTIANITPSLIGVKSCAIFLWDTGLDVFVPAAMFGLTLEQQECFPGWRISLGDVPAFDRLYFSKEPVFISPVEFEADSPGNPLSVEIFSSYDIEQISLALFPMVSHGEIFGVFLVDYSFNQSGSRPNSPASHIEWEEKIAIVQGIAHQTAVVVENLQLAKSQKEEAYVSVALLQVAQAIVSLNALDEILEAIVRITPILIGVKRCAIFLWDASSAMFRLSQAYGISRQELIALGEFHPTKDFPLLDIVRENNEIVYYQPILETESPLSWSGIPETELVINAANRQNTVMNKSGFDDSVARKVLGVNSYLIYGFPLAVKGNVLGVMITQESDRPGYAPSLHKREKNLEISVGITQQAALAIQNDLLQREVVERERLEKEFQLAREIQETFLPDRLPILSGWDLDVRWKPARQVSGDFYDVLELPDQKLGIVIADVADKGMPAALFMTLIRTLVRATVKEETSPAAVLKQVNDLLVEDAKHGLFVTIVYIILSLDTGELNYANAGHNPPVLVRRINNQVNITSDNLEEFSPTGMAIGIFPGIDIQDQQSKLTPGDCLILYTDGATEAFSPDDDMFGEERLFRTILASDVTSAKSVLDHIALEVNDFIGGAPLSDDVTLLAVRRKIN